MSIKPVGWMHAYYPPNNPQKFWQFRNTPDPWKDGTGEIKAVYAIPNTHRIVPVKPIPEMISAALPHAMRESDEDKYRAIGEIICIWYEMLAAAKEKQS